MTGYAYMDELGRGLVRGRVDRLGGHGTSMWALFGQNVCKNERIGSRREGMHPAHPLDPPMVIVINYHYDGLKMICVFCISCTEKSRPLNFFLFL